MHIEKAVSSDLESLENIEHQCFDDPWSRNIMEHQLKNCLVARDGDVLCGYICLSSVLDEGSLDNIAVLPAFRRRGTAEAMLARADEEARKRNLSFITLEVRNSNLPARRLYEKNGYEIVGIRKGYYEHPKEDAVLMTKFFIRNGDISC